jgi:hypothetical protein
MYCLLTNPSTLAEVPVLMFCRLLVQQGEARKALEVLQRPNVTVELVYKFAPDLIMLDAYETVESWMMARSKLNPGKLIPAMMRYVSEPHAKYDMQTVYDLSFSPIRVLYTSLHVGTKFLASNF